MKKKVRVTMTVTREYEIDTDTPEYAEFTSLEAGLEYDVENYEADPALFIETMYENELDGTVEVKGEVLDES